MRIHVGINQYEDGDDLDKCVADARGLADIFGGATLLSKHATRQAFIDAMILASRNPGPGAWGVITYACHGSYMVDRSGDEPDRRDECVVPTDCIPIIDDELRSIWWSHPPNTFLLVIGDCCHGGSGHYALPDQSPPGKVRFKRPETLKPLRYLPATLPDKQRAVPGVVHIGPCADRASAYEGSRFGLLTGALIETWNPKLYIGEWIENSFSIVPKDWQQPVVNASREMLAHKCAELV